MKSRDIINTALNHNQPNEVPVDFGSTATTGMHVSIVYKLRQYFGLDEPGTPVKVIEPFQMLGEIKDDLKEELFVDTVPLWGNNTFFGLKKEDWKEWKLNDETPVLVPGLFNTEKNKDGSLFQYAEGDKKYPPSAKMPAKGFFFDSIIRQKEIDDTNLNPKDNLEEFSLLDEKDLKYLKQEADKLYNCTDYAIVGTVASSGFGDIAFVPGPMLKDPKGIRDVEEWYVSLYTRQEYVKKVFSGQLEIALENYRRINEIIREKIDVVFISGTDFGMQQGLFISLDVYRDLFKPFHKKLNKWIHENTGWKTFIHTCGSIYSLIPDLIDSEFDILNPVQISAKEMEPKKLKRIYGKYITFWGGGINTQKTLAYGTADDVRNEVERLIDIFNKDGGFVFNTVHNIQANVPIKNVIAMAEAIKKNR
ncbi:MAG: uroporphyrinogen decarboxylase family protein [Actinomycetota bacterium]